MLKFFSRLEKTRNFVILLFALLLVASMVFVGASIFGTQTSGSASAGSTETVARVGSDSVTVGELVRQKENLSQMYGGRAPASKLLLDGMISQRILRQEAERLGLTASDAEVAVQIREQNKPQDGKPFDIARYEQNVADQYGSVSAYEETVRDNISGQKLRAFITSGVTASEQEVLDDFKKRNTKFDLSYVPVSVADLAQTIKPTDAELEDFFNRNKGNYYISEPQKKIRYVFLSTSKIGEKMSIPEADLRAEYEKLPEDRRQAGVQGQQIVLRVPRPEDDARIMEKANQIVERARTAGEGGKVSEPAFAELAQGQSEDPATARSGGKIPGLVKQNPNNPTDPLQQLLTMQEGEITEPIKFGEKYYILRRGAVVPKSFEDAKKELEISLRNRRAYTVAAELAQKVNDDLKQTKDAQATAQKFAAEANMSPKDMVRETGFIKPGDEVENVGVSPQFEEGIKPLENPNDVGEKTPIKDGFGIPLLIEKREPRDMTFEEAKEKVAEALKMEKARQQVEQIARDIASGAASVEAINAAAQSKGLKAQESKSFVIGSPLGQGPSAATNEELENAIYALKAGEVSKTPIKVGDNWYVVGVAKREEASMEEFAKQRDQLLQSALMSKRGQVFSDYLEGIRRRMEASQQIRIYKDALNKVDGMDADAEA
ncbi:MAG TPA: peptidyl-prolyl cis-trans isomerase [Pyrinomonadaceae bacterium]|nr:peptidyl-prolyl cis-trans isomerase [Pyrinomonadaceae bacterium]